MTCWLRALRADLRIVRRPAYVVIVLGVMLLTGLSSAMTQDTVYHQLRNAAGSAQLSCGGASPRACAQDRRERRAFLALQQRNAHRVGALQSSGGAATYAARMLGLGLGAVVMLLLASMLVSAEATRGTLDLALAGSWSPGGVAVRRWCAAVVLMLGPFAAAFLGSRLGGVWGTDNRALLSGDAGLQPTVLVGMAVLVMVYAAVASLAAWLSRKPVQTLSVGGVAIALLALTTSAGPWLPGAAAPGVLKLDSVLEFEMGYFWAWPPLTFPRGVGNPAHIVDALPWAASAGVLVVLGAAALSAAATTATARPRA